MNSTILKYKKFEMDIRRNYKKKTLESLVAQWERVGHLSIRLNSRGELCHNEAHSIGTRNELWLVKD